MGFKRGNDPNRAKGGKRNPPGGRPTKEEQQIKQTVADKVQAYIDDNVDSALGSYKKLTEVREVNHYDKEGNLLFTEEVIDGATVRHWIDKFIPAAKQELDITHKGDLIVKLIDYAARKRTKRNNPSS